MKRVFDYLTIILFCAVIVMVPVLTKIEKPAEVSLFENRKLAKPPVFSVAAVFNGTYLPHWNTYFSDHIVRRDSIMRAYIFSQVELQRKPVVSLVVLQRDVLLPFCKYTNEEYDFSQQADEMADKLELVKNAVDNYGGTLLYIGVPEQYSMLRDSYPWYLNNNDDKLSAIESSFFSALEDKGIDYVNMRSEFLRQGDLLTHYSRTDHHYNLYGAFFTYHAAMQRLQDLTGRELQVLQDSDVVFAELNNPFYGSRNRKLYNVYDSSDRLYYFTLKDPISFTRYDNGTQVEAAVLELPQEDTSPVTFSIYMGGDIGETVIDTNRPELPNALIFGDSFTNPFETFLYTSFNVTRSLDLRYFKTQPITQYIAQHKPDIVLIMRDDTVYLFGEGNGDIK